MLSCPVFPFPEYLMRWCRRGPIEASGFESSHQRAITSQALTPEFFCSPDGPLALQNITDAFTFSFWLFACAPFYFHVILTPIRHSIIHTSTHS